MSTSYAKLRTPATERGGKGHFLQVAASADHGTVVAAGGYLLWASPMPTILLVDNEPDILAALSVALEWRGYRVWLSGDGKAALEQAGRSMPDLIVTDCSMPEMDGVDLCRQLKSYPALAAIPVVMVSAQVQPQWKPALWSAFFQKPVDLDALESTVGLLLLSRPLREMLRPMYSDRAASRWQPVSSALIS